MKVIIVDLGFGDAGKGSIVDCLVNKYDIDVIVRYNGGPQAAHNVHANGVHHTFSQFGSSLGKISGWPKEIGDHKVPPLIVKTKTLLSKFMLIEPFALLKEAENLEETGVINPFENLYIDGRARIITPYHIILNRHIESFRGENRHGSCGMGIGETVRDYLENPEHKVTADHLYFSDGSLVREKLTQVLTNIHNRVKNELDKLERYYTLPSAEELVIKYQEFRNKVKIADERKANDLIRSDKVIFEGAQGVLLDQDFGFHPHTTWSTTTSENALELLKEAGFKGKSVTLGLTRTYMVRHGAGPFPTETMQLGFKDDNNPYNSFQKYMRLGYLDIPLLKYAIAVNGGIDGLVVTHTDALKEFEKWKICTNHKLMEDQDLLSETAKNLRLLKDKGISGLEYQEALGNLLRNAESEYEEIDVQNLLPYLQNKLQVAIKLASFGPERHDKVPLPVTVANRK